MGKALSLSAPATPHKGVPSGFAMAGEEKKKKKTPRLAAQVNV